MKTKTKTLEQRTDEANRRAAQETIKTTLHHLANMEADKRLSARLAHEIGLTGKAERLLADAATIREARALIETHATNDDNA